MNALGKQPLSRLALGYNTLGLQVGVLNNESKQEATWRIIETTLFIIGENKFAPSDVWWILQRLCCLKSDSFCGLCHLVYSQGLGSILNAASQHLTWASTLSSLSLEMNGFGDEGCLKLVQSYLVAGIVSYFFHTNMFAPSFAMLCHHSCILHMEYSAQLVRMFSEVYFVHEIWNYDLQYIQLYSPRVLHELVQRSTLSTRARRVGVGLEPDHIQKHRGALGRVCRCSNIMIQSDDRNFKGFKVLCCFLFIVCCIYIVVICYYDTHTHIVTHIYIIQIHNNNIMIMILGIIQFKHESF